MRKVSGGKIEVYYVGIESVKIITVLEKVLRGAVLGILAFEFILSRIAERLASYPRLQNVDVKTISLLREMDKNWKPKKETTVGKWMRMREGRRSVYVIDAKAKRDSKEFVERLYYIDKRSFDVLQAEVPFAKNPTAVKRFEMEARFRVLEQGHLVLEWSRVRIHVGLVVKNIRMEAEEAYQDYTILDQEEE